MTPEHGGWRTSSYSTNGGACVEVHPSLWRTSSHSTNGGQCIEVGSAADVVGVRDSKRREGGMLAVLRGSWAAFVREVRAGRG